MSGVEPCLTFVDSRGSAGLCEDQVPIVQWECKTASANHGQKGSWDPGLCAPCRRRAFVGVGEAWAGGRVSEGEGPTTPEVCPGAEQGDWGSTWRSHWLFLRWCRMLWCWIRWCMRVRAINVTTL